MKKIVLYCLLLAISSCAYRISSDLSYREVPPESLYSDSLIAVSYRSIDFTSAHKRIQRKADRKYIVGYEVYIENNAPDTLLFDLSALKVIRNFKELERIESKKVYRKLKQKQLYSLLLPVLGLVYNSDTGLAIRPGIFIPASILGVLNTTVSIISNKKLKSLKPFDPSLHYEESVLLPPTSSIEAIVFYKDQDRSNNGDFIFKYKSIE